MLNVFYMSFFLDGIFSGRVQLVGYIASTLDVFGRQLCSWTAAGNL